MSSEPKTFWDIWRQEWTKIGFASDPLTFNDGELVPVLMQATKAVENSPWQDIHLRFWSAVNTTLQSFPRDQLLVLPPPWPTIVEIVQLRIVLDPFLFPHGALETGAATDNADDAAVTLIETKTKSKPLEENDISLVISTILADLDKSKDALGWLAKLLDQGLEKILPSGYKRRGPKRPPSSDLALTAYCDAVYDLVALKQVVHSPHLLALVQVIVEHVQSKLVMCKSHQPAVCKSHQPAVCKRHQPATAPHLAALIWSYLILLLLGDRSSNSITMVEALLKKVERGEIISWWSGGASGGVARYQQYVDELNSVSRNILSLLPVLPLSLQDQAALIQAMWSVYSLPMLVEMKGDNERFTGRLFQCVTTTRTQSISACAVRKRKWREKQQRHEDHILSSDDWIPEKRFKPSFILQTETEPTEEKESLGLESLAMRMLAKLASVDGEQPTPLALSPPPPPAPSNHVREGRPDRDDPPNYVKEDRHDPSNYVKEGLDDDVCTPVDVLLASFSYAEHNILIENAVKKLKVTDRRHQYALPARLKLVRSRNDRAPGRFVWWEKWGARNTHQYSYFQRATSVVLTAFLPNWKDPLHMTFQCLMESPPTDKMLHLLLLALEHAQNVRLKMPSPSSSFDILSGPKNTKILDPTLHSLLWHTIFYRLVK